MKSLVSAMALAVAVAFAMPAMAQTPAAPDANAPTASKADAAKPKAGKKAGKKATHARAKAGIHKKHAMHAMKAQRHGRMHTAQARPIRHASAARLPRTRSDNVANQLNRQEMQRLSGGGMSEQTQPGTQPMYQGQ
jgi:hypothetical protein